MKPIFIVELGKEEKSRNRYRVVTGTDLRVSIFCIETTITVTMATSIRFPVMPNSPPIRLKPPSRKPRSLPKSLERPPKLLMPDQRAAAPDG